MSESINQIENVSQSIDVSKPNFTLHKQKKKWNFEPKDYVQINPNEEVKTNVCNPSENLKEKSEPKKLFNFNSMKANDILLEQPNEVSHNVNTEQKKVFNFFSSKEEKKDCFQEVATNNNNKLSMNDPLEMNEIDDIPSIYAEKLKENPIQITLFDKKEENKKIESNEPKRMFNFNQINKDNPINEDIKVNEVKTNEELDPLDMLFNHSSLNKPQQKKIESETQNKLGIKKTAFVNEEENEDINLLDFLAPEDNNKIEFPKNEERAKPKNVLDDLDELVLE